MNSILTDLQGLEHQDSLIKEIQAGLEENRKLVTNLKSLVKHLLEDKIAISKVEMASDSVYTLQFQEKNTWEEVELCIKHLEETLSENYDNVSIVAIPSGMRLIEIPEDTLKEAGLSRE